MLMCFTKKQDPEPDVMAAAADNAQSPHDQPLSQEDEEAWQKTVEAYMSDEWRCPEEPAGFDPKPFGFARLKAAQIGMAYACMLEDVVERVLKRPILSPEVRELLEGPMKELQECQPMYRVRHESTLFTLLMQPDF